MNNVNILQDDDRELKENGYVLKEKDNIITIRDSSNGELLVEIIYLELEEEDKILISSRYRFNWAEKIYTITPVYGDTLYIFYSTNDCDYEFILERESEN